MGSQLSVPEEERTLSHSSSIWYQLAECSIDKVIIAFGHLETRHLTSDRYVEPTTLAFGLPFSVSTASKLVGIFTDRHGRGDWKSCFEVLVFLVEGAPDAKLRLLFDITGWKPEDVIPRSQLESLITRLLINTERIVKADGQLQLTGIFDVHTNIEITVNELVGEIEDFSAGAGITYDVLEQWLIESTAISFDMFSKDDFQATSNSTPARLSSGKGCYQWDQLPSDKSETVPSSRSKHAVTFYNGFVYLYGGRDGNLGLKDLWKFNIGTNRWQQLLCRGDRPPLLQDHTMVAQKGKLYVFGGAFSSTHEAPLWILSLDSLVWQKHDVDGEVMVPCGRRGHTAVVVDNAMHVYGGFLDLKGSSSEFWTFDFGIEMWHLAHSASMTDEGPGGRHGHAAVVHDNEMWIFGGMCDLHPRNDLWKWNFGLRKWHKVKSKNGPHGLTGHSMSKISGGMLVYGGENVGNLQGDLWKFTFASQTWQKIPFGEDMPLARSQHQALVIPAFLVSQAWSTPTSERARSAPYLQDKALNFNLQEDRPFSSPPSMTNEKQSFSFKNKVLPADSATELLIGPFSDEEESARKDSKFKESIQMDAMSPQSPVSPVKGGREKRNILECFSESVSFQDSEVCYSLLKQTGDAQVTLDLKGTAIFKKTGPLPGHIEPTCKSKTGSVSRLLSSESESSENGLDNPSFVLDTSGNFSRRVGDKEEYCPVKKSKKHYLANRGCVSMEMKSASTESILSMSHNPALPPPYWMHASNYQNQDLKNVVHDPLKSHSESLLHDLGGIEVTRIDPDRGLWPHQVFPEDLFIEDLEYYDNDQLCLSSESAFSRDDAHSQSSESKLRAQSEANLCVPKQTALPDLLIGLSESSLNQPVQNNWFTTGRGLSRGTVKNNLQTQAVCAEQETSNKLRWSDPQNGISYSQGRETNISDKMKREVLVTRDNRESENIQAPSTGPVKDFLKLRCLRRSDTTHILVFGGKDSESLNIGIKSLPVWHLDVTTGNHNNR